MISIIIPVYNRVGLLGPTIESVLIQSYGEWELIIVDDGSTEDVGAAVDGCPAKRVTLLRQENQGNAAARNAGINAGRGEFVICLDSDDIWHSDMLLQTLAQMTQEPKIDVVYTQFQMINAQGKKLDRSPGPDPLSGDLLEPLLMGHPILPSSALVRRECFERWGAYTTGLDDWEMWLRWAAAGCYFRCLAEPLLHYRVHDQNFNLDLDRRREAHFAMLDAFYQRDDLPLQANLLKDRAYANQHFYFSEVAWMIGRPAEAVDDFDRAVRLDPRLLFSVDHYTRLACAHQGRVDAGTHRGLDLDMAEATLNDSLKGLAAKSDRLSGNQVMISKAFAWAYLSLARLAYGVAHDMVETRHFLTKSFKAWPSIAWRSDWSLWFGRALIGFETIQQAKGRVRSLGDVTGLWPT